MSPPPPQWPPLAQVCLFHKFAVNLLNGASRYIYIDHRALGDQNHAGCFHFSREFFLVPILGWVDLKEQTNFIVSQSAMLWYWTQSAAIASCRWCSWQMKRSIFCCRFLTGRRCPCRCKNPEGTWFPNAPTADWTCNTDMRGSRRGDHSSNPWHPRIHVCWLYHVSSCVYSSLDTRRVVWSISRW